MHVVNVLVSMQSRQRMLAWGAVLYGNDADVVVTCGVQRG